MTAVRKELRRRRKPLGLVAGARGSHGSPRLRHRGERRRACPAAISRSTAPPSGSNFTVDYRPPRSTGRTSTNRCSQARTQPTGQNDDSYKGGVKEDTACPDEVTGSIPNNKSDLKSYLVYQEPEADGPGFLNLGWIRVNDPSGTTLMDFELNHSSTPCAIGPNVVRTAGDLLIEYAHHSGRRGRERSRPASGAARRGARRTALPDAGDRHDQPRPDPREPDRTASARPLAARTFGEMSLDLDFIFDEETCESFGSRCSRAVRRTPSTRS